MIDNPFGYSDAARRFGKALHRLSSHPQDRSVQHAGVMANILAGVLVELSLAYGTPDEAMWGMLNTLSSAMKAQPNLGAMGAGALPCSMQIDQDIEKGRAIARDMFEDYIDCPHEFQKFFLDVAQDIFTDWSRNGLPQAEMLRVLSECAYRGLAYEMAAQELCDLMIEHRIGEKGWRLGDSISALSAVAGHYFALSGAQSFDEFDSLTAVMTQEAVRLGVPAGSNWRFGLAANDVPTSAPYELIDNLSPACEDFFTVIHMNGREDQAVACAKAAGRMLAVSAGGNKPEIEPVIAKPLAMSAMSDTYRALCMEITALAN